MYLQTLVILFSIGNTFSDFLPVPDDCKYWDYLKVYDIGEKKSVHCILDQNFQSGLVYTEWKMIPEGTCPIYNRFARQIDNIPCNRKIGMCPNNTFPSYSGIIFTGCYDAIRKKTNVVRPTVPPAVSDNSNNYPVALAVIATLLACIICMILTAYVWHFVCRSKIKLSKENVIPGPGANGECEMTMRGNGCPVTNASPLEKRVVPELGAQCQCGMAMRGNECPFTNESTSEKHVVPEIGAKCQCGMTMRGNECPFTNESTSVLENVIPRVPGQRRVLNTMEGNEYLVSNASELEKVIAREKGQRRVLNTMRGNEYLINNLSTLVADNYERVEIITDGHVAYCDSKQDDYEEQQQNSSMSSMVSNNSGNDLLSNEIEQV